MKKTLMALAFFATIGLTNANASEVITTSNVQDEYVVNDNNIEALFTVSTDASYEVASTISLNTLASNNADNNPMFVKNGGGKSALVAIILDFFIGGLGIHRIYLGTATFTWIGYILTCGGIFGLVPFVDLVVLAVNFGDVSKYEGNSKFFMW